jgi:hypothetical protein
MIELPTQKVVSVRTDPKRIVIYSKAKAGKTTALSLLNNCLILDFENGSDYVDALKLKVDNLSTLKAIGQEIIKANKPYKYIAVDTVTSLEEMCLSYAKQLYQNTPMGKNFDGDSVLKLPNGAGYLYLREAFFKILDYIESLVPDDGSIILLGHLKDKLIETNGKEVSSVDLDLSGKIKSIVCAKADAIGLLSRKGDKVILNFKTSEEVTCGARPAHLKNKELVLTEIIDGELVEHWNDVFINNN